MKPDPVDQTVRTAHTTVHHYNATRYCSTETVLLIFSFLQNRDILHVRTAHTIVHHYNATRYCSTETVLLVFPFFQSKSGDYKFTSWKV